MSCLVIDVGNTSTTVGRCSGDRVSVTRQIMGGVLHDPAGCEAAVAEVVAGGGVVGGIISSVVPESDAVWQELVERVAGCQMIRVSAGLPMEIEIDYPEPSTIGADRLANACGGVRRYGAPLLIADFGTALTFDIIIPERSYVGGVIAPGLPLMTEYLYERTALLPRVRLEGECPALGRTTQEAMRIGAQIGYRGIVREIYSYLCSSMGLEFKLVATGGYAGWALGGSGMECEIDPELTLFGLGCIFDYNSNKGRVLSSNERVR